MLFQKNANFKVLQVTRSYRQKETKGYRDSFLYYMSDHVAVRRLVRKLGGCKMAVGQVMLTTSLV